jgi:hypothetical protein
VVSALHGGFSKCRRRKLLRIIFSTYAKQFICSVTKKDYCSQPELSNWIEREAKHTKESEQWLY